MCDCSLSLVGNICLAPAGSFRFGAEAIVAERLERQANRAEELKPLVIAPGDWPVYRADNRRSATSAARIPGKVKLAWRHVPPHEVDSTAPVAAGGLVFVAGSDGIVRA